MARRHRHKFKDTYKTSVVDGSESVFRICHDCGYEIQIHKDGSYDLLQPPGGSWDAFEGGDRTYGDVPNRRFDPARFWRP